MQGVCVLVRGGSSTSNLLEPSRTTEQVSAGLCKFLLVCAGHLHRQIKFLQVCASFCSFVQVLF